MYDFVNVLNEWTIVLFVERMWAVILSSVSFVGIGYIKDVALPEVNWKKIASLNVRPMENCRKVFVILVPE